MRLDGSRRVVRTAQEHQRRSGPLHERDGRVGVDREVGTPLADHDLRAGDLGDVCVQGVGGFEDRGPAARAAVGEQQRLQDLVAPVRTQETRTRLVQKRSQCRAQLARSAVGVPVPGDIAQRFDSWQPCRQPLHSFLTLPASHVVFAARQLMLHSRIAHHQPQVFRNRQCRLFQGPTIQHHCMSRLTMCGNELVHDANPRSHEFVLRLPAAERKLRQVNLCSANL